MNSKKLTQHLKRVKYLYEELGLFDYNEYIKLTGQPEYIITRYGRYLNSAEFGAYCRLGPEHYLKSL